MDDESSKFLSEITIILGSLFPTDDFEINITDFTDLQSTFKIFIHNRKDDELCVFLQMFLSINTIAIALLNKCDVGECSGKILVERIEKFVSKLKRIKTITLHDASTVFLCDIEIKLSYLKILTKGKSWYNSLNYVSCNNELELSHNSKFINEKMNNLDITIINTLEQHSNYIQYNKKETIKSYVQRIMNLIPNPNCSHKSLDCDDIHRTNVIFLKFVVDTFTPYILYDEHRLTKSVNTQDGGKQRRKTKKKN